MTSTASAGSRDVACFFSSRVLPRPADFVLARIPLALCPDPWPIIAARARINLHRLNEAAGRNRNGGAK